MKHITQATFFAIFFAGIQLICMQECSCVTYTADRLNTSIPLAEAASKQLKIKPADILIAIDIDNTIGKPDNILASDQCVCALIPMIGLEKALKIYHTIQQQSRLIAIEPEFSESRFNPCTLKTIFPCFGTIGTIIYLQDLGYRTMALTARSLPVQECTIAQLNYLGINFTQHSPSPLSFNFDEPNTWAKIGGKDFLKHNDCRYKDGILMCGNNNKGRKLIELLEACQYMPKIIIFIDDKAKNLNDVGQAIENFNEKKGSDPIEFIGLRYSRCDEEVKDFSLQPETITQANEVLKLVRRSPIPWMSC